MKNEKYDNFARLADNRVNNALNEIRKIGNLANASTYDYKKEDVDEIFESLKAGIDNCRMHFDLSLQANGKGKFALKRRGNEIDMEETRSRIVNAKSDVDARAILADLLTTKASDG